MDELTSTFVNESRDQLMAMEDGLLKLEQNPGDADNLGAIFRAAHTIKGGSGVVECAFIEAFTHKVENVLDKLRNGEIPVSGDLSTVMLECCDHLGTLLDVLVAGRPQPDAEIQARGEALLARLTEQFLGGGRRDTSLPTEDERRIEASGGGVVDTDAWHLSVRFGPGVLKNGMDPLSFIRYLATPGRDHRHRNDRRRHPAADEMDPESCYLGFEIRLQTKSVEGRHRTRLRLRARRLRRCASCRRTATSPTTCSLITELPEDTLRLGEMLVRCGALTQAEIDQGLAGADRTATADARGASAAADARRNPRRTQGRAPGNRRSRDFQAGAGQSRRRRATPSWCACMPTSSTN
jgi:two-component system chemotaxis sensor kinase CheA